MNRVGRANMLDGITSHQPSFWRRWGVVILAAIALGLITEYLLSL